LYVLKEIVRRLSHWKYQNAAQVMGNAIMQNQ